MLHRCRPRTRVRLRRPEHKLRRGPIRRALSIRCGVWVPARGASCLGRDDRCGIVMAGLVPAIHVLLAAKKKGVDARNKCGHDREFAVRR